MRPTIGSHLCKQKFNEFKANNYFTIFSTIHHDSSRFLMVGKIGMDRDESRRKVEIFSVTTIPVRNYTIFSTVSARYRYESMTIHDGNATVNED